MVTPEIDLERVRRQMFERQLALLPLATAPKSLLNRRKLGQVILSEGLESNLISRFIRRTTDSIWTHAVIVTGPDEITEAWFPFVRTYSLSQRIAELERQDRRVLVLDYAGHNAGTRRLVVDKARSYVGRAYDVPGVLNYLIHRRFRDDNGAMLFCSRLVTASYRSGADIDLFPDFVLNRLEREGHPRVANLREGLATPADLVESILTPV